MWDTYNAVERQRDKNHTEWRELWTGLLYGSHSEITEIIFSSKDEKWRRTIWPRFFCTLPLASDKECKKYAFCWCFSPHFWVRWELKRLWVCYFSEPRNIQSSSSKLLLMLKDRTIREVRAYKHSFVRLERNLIHRNRNDSSSLSNMKYEWNAMEIKWTKSRSSIMRQPHRPPSPRQTVHNWSIYRDIHNMRFENIALNKTSVACVLWFARDTFDRRPRACTHAISSGRPHSALAPSYMLMRMQCKYCG